jgi:hypothetical protein
MLAVLPIFDLKYNLAKQDCTVLYIPFQNLNRLNLNLAGNQRLDRISSSQARALINRTIYRIACLLLERRFTPVGISTVPLDREGPGGETRLVQTALNRNNFNILV